MLVAVSWFSPRAGGPPLLRPGPDKWAVVDVETSGLSARGDRVLSVAAITLDANGRPEKQFSTLLNPGCDPGPTHVHGLTRAMLAGKPQFADVREQLWSMLEGRILVAHNASFDHSFLQAEASRAGLALPTTRRLCTLALSRRLGLDLPNYQLGTLTSYWNVKRGRAHDAYDDARALADVFAYSVDLADRLGMALPVVDEASRPAVAVYPATWVKQPSQWHNPGRLEPGEPLVQGMKIVVTGATREPRETIYARLEAAGLEVMSSVSRMTSVVVCNDLGAATGKLARAVLEGTPVVDEPTLARLVVDVRPGTPKAARLSTVPAPALSPEADVAPGAERATAPPAAGSTPQAAAPHAARPAPGPFARRRVLVLGGGHDEAASIRETVVARGGSAAVNLSVTVTDIVVLPGGEADPRIARAQAAGVKIRHSLAEVLVGIDAPAATARQSWVEPVVLPRGGVVDLPDSHVWVVNASWSGDVVDAELDVVALILDEAGRVATDEDFVFYNAPASEDDAVVLSVDGGCQQSIRIDLDRLPEHARRVIVAAALEGKTTFGDLGAIAIGIDSVDATVATSTLDAGTTEQTMLLAEIYLRGEQWRVRAVGQGHDYGLAALATSYGVDVG